MASHLSTTVSDLFSCPPSHPQADPFRTRGPPNCFDPFERPNWPMKNFCDALHRSRADSSKLALRSVEYCKRLDHHDGCWHEYLIFQIVPFDPRSNGQRYIEVKRTTMFGITGSSRTMDKVVVLGEERPPIDQAVEESLATLVWLESTPLTTIPSLIDVFDNIQLLSLTYPHCTFATHQCHWFAQAIFKMLWRTYEYDEPIDHYHFLRLLGSTSVPSNILKFAEYKRQCTDIWKTRGRNESVMDMPSHLPLSKSVLVFSIFFLAWY
ncbi:hypothetical protein JVT61DRAFT_2820 [Boletus reticuloceps]|uniref:Uncharacterized protein n=1 Tax=Boletus reticuloceps TaxID=495285 RepID=A0A8I2YR80_9AGAM|nr:hypothetical protein JVT61DRAFT_2820 [Boletus reticuloceps]